MIELSRNAVALLALVCGVWLAVATWLSVGAWRRSETLRARQAALELTGTILNASPALPMLVRPDGRVESSELLFNRLGLTTSPASIDEALTQLEGRDRDDLGKTIKEASAT